MKSTKKLIIAIDGPGATGKGTLAPKLAEKIGGIHFYTGGMYRALALACFENGVAIDDESNVIKLLQNITIEMVIKKGDTNSRVTLNGKDVSDKVINSECAVGASSVATYPAVREILSQKQREIALDVAASGIPVIMEGQDIATHVLPEADFKIFLTADINIRAKRRQEQYNALGIMKSFAEVLDETKKRDRNEITRKVNPLTTEPEKFGYFVFDNSKCTSHETFENILTEMHRRKLIQ